MFSRIYIQKQYNIYKNCLNLDNNDNNNNNNNNNDNNNNSNNNNNNNNEFISTYPIYMKLALCPKTTYKKEILHSKTL